jgi:hypothetical protein
MDQSISNRDITIQELITLINDSEEDCLISINLGEEADIDAKEGQIQA